MASHGERGLSAYGPASLDFINLPNPVEPHAAPHQHPLNNTSRSDRTSEQDFLRIVQNPGANLSDPPVKRRKSGADNGLNLPLLPIRDERRTLLPPTLTGLYQPPPDAGLLPSISIDKPDASIQRPERPKVNAQDISGNPSAAANGIKQTNGVPDPPADRRKPRKWNEDETSYLLKGVARFGIGKWTQILNCSDYHFSNRSALDLKDRFRVCCPREYNKTQEPKVLQCEDGMEITLSTPLTGRDRKSASRLRKIGIEQPFARSSRRKRRDYSQEEDDAIKKGVEKHHTAWSAILQDDEFRVLRSRHARDLRDRYRTRFPEEYKSLGLASKPNDVPSKSRVANAGDGLTNIPSDGGKYRNSRPTLPRKRSEPTTTPALPPKRSEPTTTPSHTESHSQPTVFTSRIQNFPPLLSDSDVFWGAPLDSDETEGGPLILVREIMDWALQELGRSDGQTHLELASPDGQGNSNNFQASGSSMLPPIAALTSGAGDGFDDSALELPSLMNGLGHVEVDGRAGGQFGGFYDIMN